MWSIRNGCIDADFSKHILNGNEISQQDFDETIAECQNISRKMSRFYNICAEVYCDFRENSKYYENGPKI